MFCFFSSGVFSYHHYICMIYLSQFRGKSTDKARGLLRLMKMVDVLAYLHLLRDVLSPLHSLSVTLQANATTLADVLEKMDSTTLFLMSYLSRHVNSCINDLVPDCSNSISNISELLQSANDIHIACNSYINSITNTLELQQSCIKPMIYRFVNRLSKLAYLIYHMLFPENGLVP